MDKLIREQLLNMAESKYGEFSNCFDTGLRQPYWRKNTSVKKACKKSW